ncbi:High affinity copper uptake protein 1 [Pseudolycoriella hygida]|uniref:Copper transport protein n=1 Tax=Pseudolycoriella hygida TaxID=35572 RepID=A0A9Q0RYF9_9DIPT|nr:High affinity copper uptake protein 1 [Pseudolycoriella hygida]
MDYIRQHQSHEEDDNTKSCPMIMMLHTGNCESIVFKSIKVTTAEEFALAVLVIFVFAIAYEGLRFWREKMYNDYMNQTSSCSSKEAQLAGRRNIKQLLIHKVHLTQTALHMIQATVSYSLMLIVMTYNVWLVLAVILGATVGYFFFGWIRQRSIDVAENCCH